MLPGAASGAPGHQEARAVERGGHHVGLGTEGGDGNGRVVDCLEQPGGLVVVGPDEPGSGVRRRGQDDTLGVGCPGARHHRPTLSGARQPLDRFGEPDLDTARGQSGPERLDERPHALTQGPKEGWCVVLRRWHLSSQRPHQTAPALRRREQRREGGGGRHVVHGPRMDATEQRVGQYVDHALAELARDQRSNGAVADRTPDVGPREEHIADEGELPARAEQASARVGQKRVGIPSACPSGSARNRPRAQTDAPRAAIGTNASPRPTSRQRSMASGRRPRNPSGPSIDSAPAHELAVERAAETLPRPPARPPRAHPDGARPRLSAAMPRPTR